MVKEHYDDDQTQRDLELENIAGDLMIAEYQVDKLRRRLSQQVRDIGYGSFGSKKTIPNEPPLCTGVNVQ
jgi:hypothetical protein